MDWQDAKTTMLLPLADTARVGLVTDMDGTISPIVNVPDAAQVTPRSRDLLRALVPCLTLVAVISGRSVSDVQARVGLPGLVYVGNHGLERWADGQATPAPEVAAFRPALEAALDAVRARQVPGMWLEDKGATLSIHYRQADDPSQVAATFAPFLQALAAQYGLDFFGGRMIFELRPPLNVNKGTALRQLIVEHTLAAAVFLGDDTTDVDALRMARRLRQEGTCYALGLGVDSDGTPETVREAADVLVAGVAGVESFLAWLLEARQASSSCV